MEPDHGGFYINSGPLQFKRLANFERPEDAHRMPKPRKVTYQIPNPCHCSFDKFFFGYSESSRTVIQMSQMMPFRMRKI